MRSLLILSLFCSFAVARPWTCTPSTWQDPPQVNDDRFFGTLTTACDIKVRDTDPQALREALYGELMNWGHHNRNPVWVGFRDKEGWKFDHTTGTGSQQIREEVVLVPAEKGLFLRGDSLHIHHALLTRRSYDLSVLIPDPGTLRVTLKMDLELKRPFRSDSVYLLTGKQLGIESLDSLRQSVFPRLASAAATKVAPLP